MGFGQPREDGAAARGSAGWQVGSVAIHVSPFAPVVDPETGRWLQAPALNAALDPGIGPRPNADLRTDWTSGASKSPTHANSISHCE
jgi:hypothetical protein